MHKAPNTAPNTAPSKAPSKAVFMEMIMALIMVPSKQWDCMPTSPTPLGCLLSELDRNRDLTKGSFRKIVCMVSFEWER
jgi:hypothetical protein